MKKTTEKKSKMICPNCKKADFYNTIAGQVCWDCDVLAVEATEEKDGI